MDTATPLVKSPKNDPNGSTKKLKMEHQKGGFQLTKNTTISIGFALLLLAGIVRNEVRMTTLENVTDFQREFYKTELISMEKRMDRHEEDFLTKDEASIRLESKVSMSK